MTVLGEGPRLLSLLVRLLLLILIASLPAIAIVGYNEVELRHAREAEVRDQALRLAHETAAELERTVEGVRGLLVTLAELPVVRDRDGAACTAFLSRLRRNYPDYLVISVADARGIVYCNSSDLTRVPDVSDRINFQRAVATGSFAVGEYIDGRVSGRRLIPFAYPFRDEEGRNVAGAVLAGVDLDWLDRHLTEKSLPPGTMFGVVDQTGTYLVRRPGSEAWVGRPLPERLQRIVRVPGPFVGEDIGADDIERIGALVPVRFGAGNELIVVIGLSKAEAFAPVEQATRRDVALIGAGLVLAVLAALLGGRYFIRRPIAGLAATAARWREGDYGARVDLRDRA